LLGELLVLPSCISQEKPSGVRRSLYDTPSNTDVTPGSAPANGLPSCARRSASLTAYAVGAGAGCRPWIHLEVQGILVRSHRSV